jgi:FtsZ-binding cell division protein ZapB
MEQATVAQTIAALIDRIEELQAENGRIAELNTSCGKAVRELVARAENLKAQNEELKLRQQVPKRTEYRKRPPVMRGRTVQANVGCGPLYITMNEDEAGNPFEVFFKLGKSGSCQQSYLEALGVAMSVGLRYGADPQKFIEKFEGMRCPNPKMRDGHGPTTLSCADGISQGLAKALTLALPLDTTPEVRNEASVVPVAEPQFPYSKEEQLEQQANAKSIDLIGHTGIGKNAGAGKSNGNGNGSGGTLQAPAVDAGGTAINVRRAMQTGVGMCPKCSGPLISQGGCIQCLQQCGYVGKCS